MDFEPPDEEAYGRVTNPERFQPVVTAARSLIKHLVDNYEVGRSAGTAAEDFPGTAVPAIETIRLTPKVGVPLVFMITDFPGVVVRFGEWGNFPGFPSCGCDACDESPDDVIEDLNRQVSAAVNGNYAETLTKRKLTLEFRYARGSQRSESTLRRGEWRQYGSLGTHTWPPWARRET